MKAKVQLAMAINAELAARGIPNQAEAARLLGTDQPKISLLANYKLAGFSVAKLMEFLTALDRDVEIVIRPRLRTGAHFGPCRGVNCRNHILSRFS